MNARSIAKGLLVSPPAISKALPSLEKMEFIVVKKDKESKRLSIELNRDHHMIVWRKRADNLLQLYESGFVEYLIALFPGSTVIVFGSYSLGEDTVTSDIDIAVIGCKDRDLEFKKFEGELERKINCQFFDSLSSLDPHLLNNILNGITLKGTIEL